MIIDVQGCPTSPDTSAFYEKMHWELRELEAKAAKYDALERKVKRLEDAISWALGEGNSDFGENKPENAPVFWWRKELRERAIPQDLVK